MAGDNDADGDDQNAQVGTRLIARRGQLKAQLTRFKRFINDPINLHKIVEIEYRCQKIEQVFDQFNSVQSELELIDVSETLSEERSSFEDDFYEHISKAKQILSSFYQRQNMQSSQNATISQVGANLGAQPSTSSQAFNVQLPPLVLPEFDGTYDKWTTFFDAFSALIHNNPNLNNIQKYYYLQSSLKKDAAHIIDSLEVTDANYMVAWGLLSDRYENKKFIIKNNTKQIFDLPSVTKDSFSSLRSFLDNFQKHFRALKNLQEPVDSWSTMLIHLLLSKLDLHTKREWEIKTKDDISPQIQTFIKFLTERCHVLESVDNNKAKPSPPSYQHFDNRKPSPINKVQVNVLTNKNCLYCKGDNHIIYYCKAFKNLSASSRLDEVRKLKACTNCLRLGHLSSTCDSVACRICNHKHNSLLHLGKQAPSNNKHNATRGSNSSGVHSQEGSSDMSTNLNTTNEANSFSDNLVSIISNTSAIPSTQNLNAFAHSYDKSFVILSTALVYIFDFENKPIICRVLLDGGSQSNFITNELFKKLKIVPYKINTQVVGISGQPFSICQMVKSKIKSLNSNYNFNLSFLVTEQITGNTPQFNFESSTLRIPTNIELADPTFAKSDKIDLLLGAGIFYNLLLSGQISLGTKNQPLLQNTKLGWVVAGPCSSVPRSAPTQNNSYCNLSNFVCNLDDQVEKFWLLEECQVKDVSYSLEESEVEQHFKDTYQRENSGNFIVRLPFRENYKLLGESEKMATQRFFTLERKLLKNSNLLEMYCSFMNEYKEMGHMSPILPFKQSSEELNYFLPHHSVVKESSLTTKLRVVFDASAKTTTNLSLNDVLKIGPCIQNSIFYILIRFRVHDIVFTADIAKMYRCVKMHVDDQQYQRILWRADPSEPLVQYKLETVTYGTAPASFLATRCLRGPARVKNWTKNMASSGHDNSTIMPKF